MVHLFGLDAISKSAKQTGEEHQQAGRAELGALGTSDFVLNQWDRLTRFCDVPGVPLDTNLVEQALILPVRYFVGSFKYHTEDGAVVGDRAMSLIATARAHDVEPVRVVDGARSLQRGPRPEARALLALGVSRATEGRDASEAP